MPYDAEIKTATEAAVAAGAVQIDRRKRNLHTATKPDRSPVTEVDTLCETVIRDMLAKRFPRDGFLGEETGEEKGSSGRKWIVDPLDGTRPYIRGLPTFSVLIALEDGDELVTGCMHLPAMGELYLAQKGKGAFCNNSRIHVSSINSPGHVIGSGFGFVEKAATQEGKTLVSLMQQWDYAYGFMDAFTYGCIAAGKLDACVNLLDKPWDCAAAACIVSEAGGRYSDIKGNHSVYNGSIILSNGFIHDAVLEYFQ
jgi:histidinol phosphatase-like enzyme (inositol monophosphatase family)